MKIECPGCKKVYNVPDEKLPKKQFLSLKCPNCKGNIKVDLSDKFRKMPAREVALEKIEPWGDALKTKILKNVKALPPMPHVMMKAREVMADDMAGFKEISKVLETDQAMATRILKLANSAYYGLTGEVTSIHQASVVLGTETLVQLITVVSTSKLLGSSLKGYGLDSGALWRHSLAVGVGAELIAKKRRPKLEKDAFSAGLIHDSGKLILDSYVLERKDAFTRLFNSSEVTYLKAEQMLLGIDHAQIGADFCTLWKIPEMQSSAIRFHHKPTQSETSDLAYMINIADALAVRVGYGSSSRVTATIDPAVLEFFTFDESDLVPLVAEIRDAVDTIEDNLL